MQVKLAAKAKMEGNLSDLLPKKFIPGGLKVGKEEDSRAAAFTDTGLRAQVASSYVNSQTTFNTVQAIENKEDSTVNQKWSTVVFSEMPDERKDRDMTKEKVNSPKKRFETKNMKDNEAYVIM